MSRGEHHPGWVLLAGFIGLSLLGFLLYAHTFQAPFFFDDYPTIVENPNIRTFHLMPEKASSITKGAAFSRPVAMMTFAANYLFHRYRLPGYHLINIIIHITVAFLVLLVAWQTLRLCGIRSLIAPIFAALLWMASPLHTQSVTYIVQRMNALAAMFYLLALSCYIKARYIQTDPAGQRPTGRGGHLTVRLLFCGTVLFGIMGLATKPTVSTLPLVLIFYEWCFFQKLSPKWLKKKVAWVIIALVVFFLIAFAFLGPAPVTAILSLYDAQHFTIGQRLLTEIQVIPYYLSLIVFPYPARLSLLYDFPLSTAIYSPPSTILALFSLIMLVGGGVVLSRKNNLMAFAIFWLLSTLIIESTIIGLAIIYDHRTYLPSIFPVIALTALLYRYVNPKVFIAVMCVLIGVSSIWTYQRNLIWSDRVAFWRDEVAKSPQNPRPYNNLGMAQRQRGEFKKALRQFKYALQLAPRNEAARINLGLTLSDLGDTPGAIKQLQSVLADDPDSVDARLYLARLLLQDVRIDQAIGHLSRIISIYPHHLKAALCLGRAYNKRGQPDNAIPYLKKVLAQFPDNPSACIALGRSYALKDDLAQATAWLRRAIQIQPTSAPAYNDLANVMARQGKTDQARHLYRKALQYAPKYETARMNLANLCARTDHIDQAIRLFSTLIKKTRPNPTMLYKLGLLYEKKGDIVAALKLYQNIFNHYPASRPVLPAWTAVMP